MKLTIEDIERDLVACEEYFKAEYNLDEVSNFDEIQALAEDAGYEVWFDGNDNLMTFKLDDRSEADILEERLNEIEGYESKWVVWGFHADKHAESSKGYWIQDVATGEFERNIGKSFEEAEEWISEQL